MSCTLSPGSAWLARNRALGQRATIGGHDEGRLTRLAAEQVLQVEAAGHRNVVVRPHHDHAIQRVVVGRGIARRRNGERHVIVARLGKLGAVVDEYLGIARHDRQHAACALRAQQRAVGAVVDGRGKQRTGRMQIDVERGAVAGCRPFERNPTWPSKAMSSRPAPPDPMIRTHPPGDRYAIAPRIVVSRISVVRRNGDGDEVAGDRGRAVYPQSHHARGAGRDDAERTAPHHGIRRRAGGAARIDRIDRERARGNQKVRVTSPVGSGPRERTV